MLLDFNFLLLKIIIIYNYWSVDSRNQTDLRVTAEDINHSQPFALDRIKLRSPNIL